MKPIYLQLCYLFIACIFILSGCKKDNKQSNSPVVNTKTGSFSISPLKADIGDVLTIKGKDFLGPLYIQFGDQVTNAASISDSIITVVVPAYIRELNPVISIHYATLIDTVTTQFSLNTPVITNFTSLGTFRDTVVINGDHFGFQNSLNVVTFGNATATVLSSSRKQLKVAVPDNVPNSFTNISITAQIQTVTTTTKFQITPPTITAITSFGNVSDRVVIKGTYFNPVPNNNNIFSEGIQAQIASGNTSNTTQLAYIIPNCAYPRRKATISLKLLDYTVTFSQDMLINDKWVIVNNAMPFNGYGQAGAFTINNLSYVIASTQNSGDNTQYLWKFNPTDFSWQQITIPFNANHGIVTTNGTKAYLYTLDVTNNFWEYDPTSNTWTQKADYPAGERDYSTMFAINNNVYLGLGSSTQSMGIAQADDSFYEYDINTNTWQRIADYPDASQNTFGIRNGSSSFVINKVGYVGCGATNTGMYSFFAYSPATRLWTRIHDFTDARSYTTSFTLGNYGYIATGTPVGGSPTRACFRYDPGGDTWTLLPDYVGCNTCLAGIERGFAFVNNGYVYVGGSSSTVNFPVWQALGSSL